MIRIAVTASPLPPYQDAKSDSLTYELALARLKRTSTYRIDSEALENRCEKRRRKSAEAFVLLKRDQRHSTIYDMNRQAIDVREAVVPEQETLLSSNQGAFSVNPFVSGFREQMAAWSIYQDFHTDRDAAVRSPVIARVENQVDADGQNLIAVLHTLYTESRQFKRDLNTAMQAAFGEDFDKLEFPPAADQRVQLRVHWNSLRPPDLRPDYVAGCKTYALARMKFGDPCLSRRG